jgi:3-dehydroquinate synthase
MIGAFYQPKCVIADTETLASLPARELSAGLAEVAKYGAIRYSDFFSWLEDNSALLMAHDQTALRYAVQRACDCKADIVSEDETEQGVRAILNFGHTFGHPIETHDGYLSWLHGEAVAVGMCLAANMSRRLGDINQSAVERIAALLTGFGLPINPPEDMTVADFQEHMRHDKKVRDGRIHLVLLEALGKAYVTDQYPDSVLTATLDQACAV